MNEDDIAASIMIGMAVISVGLVTWKYGPKFTATVLTVVFAVSFIVVYPTIKLMEKI